ncbi:cytochrome P450 [Panaeolus papilionaceus]|nr:cytochrome P450 [Panaeolus papilionaceus]
MYGEHTLILNRLEYTVELFEKRMGWDFNFKLQPYGAEWRDHRKSTRKYFDKGPATTYMPIQTSKNYNCDYNGYVIRLYTPDEQIDYFVHLSEVAMAKLVETMIPAQSEIDNITNRDRLPTFDHRPSLPYIEALMRELFRWRPPLPLNAPHLSTERDIYKGYYIPKGTVVIANIWAMSRNEGVYPEPEEFKPELFLNADGSLKEEDEFFISFGHGGRICPGKHIALGNLYIVVASVSPHSTSNPRKAQKYPPILTSQMKWSDPYLVPGL